MYMESMVTKKKKKQTQDVSERYILLSNYFFLAETT